MSDYTNSQMRELIEEHVHHQRNRNLLCRRLIDGVGYEALGEEFDLSTQRVKAIVSQEKTKLYRYL